MSQRKFVRLLCAAAVALASTTASAQSIDVFLAIPGIPGDSLDAKHAGEIDVVGVGQGVFDEVSGKNKGVGCNVTVTKYLDSAGPALWMAAVGKEILPEAKITFRKAGGDMQEFYEIRMTNISIGTIGTTTQIGSLPAEQVTMLPQGVTLSFKPQRADGSLGPAIVRAFTCGL